MRKIVSTTYTVILKKQSGFRPGDSTLNQLSCLVNESMRLEHWKCVQTFLRLVINVWDEGLNFKLIQNGISGKLSKILRNLRQRKQRVVLNGYYSDQWRIKGGGEGC